MHLIIQHDNGHITHVHLTQIVAQHRQSLAVTIDPERHAAYLAANAGATVPRSAYEAATMHHATCLLIIDSTGTILTLPATTAILKVKGIKAELLIDFLRHWRAGKYKLEDNTITPHPAWQEPTFTIPPLDAHAVETKHHPSAP